MFKILLMTSLESATTCRLGFTRNLLLLSSSLFFFSCQQAENAKPFSKQEPPPSCTTYYLDNLKDTLEYCQHFFHSDGCLWEEITFSANGDTTQVKRYAYGKNWRSETSYEKGTGERTHTLLRKGQGSISIGTWMGMDTSGTLHSREVWSYRQDGTLKGKTKILKEDNSYFRYSYDDLGREVEYIHTQVSKGEVTTLSYSSFIYTDKGNGRVIVTEKGLDNEPMSTRYYEWGRLQKEIPNPNIHEKTDSITYHYNENRCPDCPSSRIFHYKGSIKDEFSYHYDRCKEYLGSEIRNYDDVRITHCDCQHINNPLEEYNWKGSFYLPNPIDKYLLARTEGHATYKDTIFNLAFDSLEHRLGYIPMDTTMGYGASTKLVKYFKYLGGNEPLFILTNWTTDPHYISKYPQGRLVAGRVYPFTIHFFHKGKRGKMSKQMGFLLSNGERITIQFKGEYVE